MDTCGTARPLLERVLRNSRTAAIAAAFVTLGALAVPDPASAGVSVPQRSSRVDGTVTPEGGQFRYKFEVFNTTRGCEGCPQIVDWELPIFSLTDVVASSILSPSGWLHEVIAPGATTAYYNNPTGPYGFYNWDYVAANDPLLVTNPDLYGPNPGVFDNPPFIIHWYTEDIPDSSPANPINAGESLDGFEFLSAFSEFNAPYLSSWFFQPPVSGDPPSPNAVFATPNSPARQLAQATAIPAPASVALIGIGLLGLVPYLRRRKSA